MRAFFRISWFFPWSLTTSATFLIRESSFSVYLVSFGSFIFLFSKPYWNYLVFRASSNNSLAILSFSRPNMSGQQASHIPRMLYFDFKPELSRSERKPVPYRKMAYTRRCSSSWFSTQLKNFWLGFFSLICLISAIYYAIRSEELLGYCCINYIS